MAITPMVSRLALRALLVGKMNYGNAETIGSINRKYPKRMDG